MLKFYSVELKKDEQYFFYCENCIEVQKEPEFKPLRVTIKDGDGVARPAKILEAPADCARCEATNFQNKFIKPACPSCKTAEVVTTVTTTEEYSFEIEETPDNQEPYELNNLEATGGHEHAENLDYRCKDCRQEWLSQGEFLADWILAGKPTLK